MKQLLSSLTCFLTSFSYFVSQTIFRVMGFSVMGRVLNSPNGEGVAEAVVTLNNQIKGNCDATLK